VITKIDPGATLRHVLQHVRAATLSAFAHQDLPFDEIVAGLRPERVSNYAPLHQVLFNVLNVQLRPLELPGVVAERPSPAGRIAAKFDLHVAIDLTRDGLSGALEFDRDLFERSTIERLVADYRAVVAHLLGAPEQLVSNLTLMSAAQTRLRDAFLTDLKETEEDQHVRR
jgi:non-ribosomal peptide synthetase component F